MKKKILKAGISLLVIVIVSFFSVYFIQNKYVINKLDNLFVGADIEKGDLTKIKSVRCNLNIFKPEYAITHDLFNNISNEFNIYFFNQKSVFNFETERVGGTTVKNTTFNNLLKIVKEDCYQFQKPKGHSSDKVINWRWSPAPTAEEKLKNEREKKEQEEQYKKEVEEWNNLSEEEKEKELEEQQRYEEEMEYMNSPEVYDEIDKKLKELGL